MISSQADHSPTASVALTTRELVGIFLRTGTLAFGGGGATLSMLHSEFCLRRPVLSEEEFQLLFGLSRLVPGMNLLSLTVLLGYRSHGVTGALLALLALTVPSFAIIVAGCLLLRGGHASPLLARAVRGLSVGATALLLDTAWRQCRGALVQQARRTRVAWVALMLVALLLARGQVVSAAAVVIGGGLLGGLLFPRFREPAS